jgi:peptidoglycan LD-endopeptidase LytH
MSGSSGTQLAIIGPVHTFRILAAGWLIGGLGIVAFSGIGVPVSPPSEIRAAGTAASQPAGGRRSGVLIPVLGIEAHQLKDTYSQARGRGRTHNALDILAPRNTPVVAAVDGTIRKLFFSKGGGVTIYQFDEAEEKVYYYAHLERYADGLKEGQFVRQGEVIGYVGVSGNAPPGTPHLHFAIEILGAEKLWWKATPVNPYPILTAAPTTRASVLR